MIKLQEKVSYMVKSLQKDRVKDEYNYKIPKKNDKNILK